MNLIANLSKKMIAFRDEAENELGFKPNDIINGDKSTLFDIGIITSSPAELNAVKKILLDVNVYEHDDDDATIYYCGFLESQKKRMKIILPVPSAMGIESTIITTTSLLANFNLKFIFMVGIAAGNKNVTKIGDIIIAEKSLNYNHVVEIQGEGKEKTKKFMQSADSIHRYLKTRFDLFANSLAIAEIKTSYKAGSKINNELKCHVGLLVTGSSLIRSDEKIADIIKTYHGIKGLDMETSGFYYAVSNAPKDSSPYFASIKSVSDFGDNSSHVLKQNERRSYALHTSASVLAKFIENHI